MRAGTYYLDVKGHVECQRANVQLDVMLSSQLHQGIFSYFKNPSSTMPDRRHKNAANYLLLKERTQDYKSFALCTQLLSHGDFVYHMSCGHSHSAAWIRTKFLLGILW